MSEESRPQAKPLFLIKPKTMSPKDIRRAEKYAGIIIAECEEPESARLLEPPIDAKVDLQAHAALRLFRHVVGYEGVTNFGKPYLMQWFLNALMLPPIPPIPPVKRK